MGGGQSSALPSIPDFRIFSGQTEFGAAWMKTSRPDLYSWVTNAVVADLENGVRPWSAAAPSSHCRTLPGSARYPAMPKFITIGFGDQAGYDQTDKAVRDAAHAVDAERVRQGDIMGIAGQPVQVRNHDAAKIEVTQGAYLSAGLPIAGFALIEAPDLDSAIAIAAHSPCAVAQGVIEVWPLDTLTSPIGRAPARPDRHK